MRLPYRTTWRNTERGPTRHGRERHQAQWFSGQADDPGRYDARPPLPCASVLGPFRILLSLYPYPTFLPSYRPGNAPGRLTFCGRFRGLLAVWVLALPMTGCTLCELSDVRLVEGVEAGLPVADSAPEDTSALTEDEALRRFVVRLVGQFPAAVSERTADSTASHGTR